MQLNITLDSPDTPSIAKVIPAGLKCGEVSGYSNLFSISWRAGPVAPRKESGGAFTQAPAGNPWPLVPRR